MHIYWMNGLLAMLALAVISYFIAAVVRTAWQSTRPAQFFLLLAEGVLALVIFGIVDYPGEYPPLWFVIILWLLVRAVTLHRRLAIPLPEPTNPFDFTI